MKDLSYMFKNEQFSDVDVVIRLAAQDDSSNHSDADITMAMADGSDACSIDVDQVPESSGRALVGLAAFPGHLAILCQCDVFHAKVQFKNDTQSATGSRPTLSVIVDDASHVPAVEAIIASLYGVKGALEGLQQHQLVHVIKYTDMLQLDSVAQEAVQQLVTEAAIVSGLSDEVLDVLHQFVWPQCLLPLLPVLADSMGSNLELIWENEQLSRRLMKLPLPAVQLLLSSDHRKVYSEDTVLYTATRYVMAQPDEQQSEASQQLSRLVRAPHLSDFQLTAQAANDDQTAISIMLSHKPMLQKLLALKRLGPVSASDVARLLPTAPESWQLPARQILPANTDGVKLLWQVPISDFMTAYNSCTETKRIVSLHSTSVTAPVSGIAWRLQLQCRWDEAGQGVLVGAYSEPTWCTSGVIYRETSKIKGPGSASYTGSSPATTTPYGCGWSGFFKTGVLQGPLQSSAWVDEGLPMTGSIELRLTVYKVL